MISFFASMAGAIVGSFIGIFAITWTIVYAINECDKKAREKDDAWAEQVQSGRAS